MKSSFFDKIFLELVLVQDRQIKKVKTKLTLKLRVVNFKLYLKLTGGRSIVNCRIN